MDNTPPDARSFEREVLDRLIVIETKLDGVESMKKVSYENQRDIISIKKDNDEQEKRIQSLEDNNKWLWRAIVSSVIVAIVGIIGVYLKSGLGI